MGETSLQERETTLRWETIAGQIKEVHSECESGAYTHSSRVTQTTSFPNSHNHVIYRISINLSV